METSHISVLAEHYRDTFDVITRWHRSRELMFASTLILGVAMLMNSLGGGFISSAVSAYIVKETSTQFTPDIRILGSLLWFLWFGSMLKYFQAQVRLENLYGYIKVVEERLTLAARTVLIDREGGHYSADYPRFSMLSHLIYTVLVPLLLVSMPVVLIVSEWRRAPFSTYHVIDSACAALMLICTGFYCGHIHKKKT